MEHISTINGILDQAKEVGLPVGITFLDLKNAFGSVSHDLIADMLNFVKVPHAIINYVKDCYSQLQRYVATHN